MESENANTNNFQSGNLDAFEVIFHAHYKALVRYAQTILNDRDDAEDVVQQVFISVWNKGSLLNIHTSARAMLYKSVHNACLNRIKQQQVRNKYAKEVQFYGETSSAETVLQHKELQNIIEEALTKLPEQCGKIFKMSRFEQLKYHEIATQLGLSIKTVENQMGKALKIMKEELKNYLPLLLFILNQYFLE